MASLHYNELSADVGINRTMLFSPLPRPERLQLRISERRLLMRIGDSLAVIAAVAIALFIWTIVAKYEFSSEFLRENSVWFIILVPLWLTLASANASTIYGSPASAAR